MTAAAADRDPQYAGVRQEIRNSVAATTTLYGGTMICRNAAGDCVAGAATAGFKLAGVCMGDPINGTSGVDNSTGAAADKYVTLRTRGIHMFVCSGLTKADIGKPVFLVDDQTVTLTAGLVFAGILKDFSAAAEAQVDIEPATLDPGNLGVSKNMFILPFSFIGAVGSSTVIAKDDTKMPRAFKVLRGAFDAQTAPGGAYICTCTITNGTTAKTMTMTGAAVHGENDAINQVYAAATDMTINLIDNHASGATANVSGHFVCEWL